MGHGASTTHGINKLFVHSEAVEGSKYLADDTTFRDSFISFIKGGIWIAQVPNLNLCNIHTNGQVSNYLGYKSKKSVSDIDRLSRAISVRLSSKRSLSNASITSSSRGSQQTGDHVVAIDGVNCFTANELVSMLCCVVYPMYVASADVDDDLASLSGEDMRGAPLFDKDLSTTQKFFKLCAEYFSEEDLTRTLSSPNWVAGPTGAFDSHHLGITICDTGLEGSPIVYANKSFSHLTGYTTEHLMNKNFSLFAGAETEDEQVKLLQDAMRYSRAEKVAVTHVTKGRRSFVNLISIVPVGRFSVAIHMPAAKDITPEELKTVDDTLMLLHSLLKVREQLLKITPAPRSRKSSKSSWLPSVSLACELCANALISRSFSASSQDDTRCEPFVKLPVLERTLEVSAEHSFAM